ncbi:MAG: beta-aspartyl-peptidase, partial [Candidatus Tectomicrobia bacterium]|nr:beta-aspartyl-peptidase [Candidatus Tectomicrobia bacterium]
MRLEMGIFPVRKAVFGGRTGYRDGTLTVNTQELKEEMMAEGGFLDVRFDLAHPGESVRIVHNVDA